MARAAGTRPFVHSCAQRAAPDGRPLAMIGRVPAPGAAVGFVLILSNPVVDGVPSWLRVSPCSPEILGTCLAGK